ncbi:MAG: glycosyltransferase family 2 protein [Micrococcales bacterium]|nr:glycosyltransferase family 2 protein [Micrococcales bacterium]
MREKSALLSICIPTYNRSAYLRQCLAAVLPQAEECHVPVIVSDNGSIDGTGDVIEFFSKKFDCLQYLRQEVNLGHDLNHKAILNATASTYAWLLGDDDVIESRAISTLLSFLGGKERYDLILLNAYLTDNDLRPEGYQFNLKDDLLINNCNDLLANYSDKLTFGMIVVDVDKFNNAKSDRFVGTGHYYGGVVYDYLADVYRSKGRNNICIYSLPLVKLRQGIRAWTVSICDINLRCVPLFFIALDPLYTVNANKALNAATRSFRLLHTALQARRSGWLDRRYLTTLADFYHGWPWSTLWLISRLPEQASSLLCSIWSLASKCWHPLKRAIYGTRSP